jgi:Carboxypeptidase regulatory-like domain
VVLVNLLGGFVHCDDSHHPEAKLIRERRDSVKQISCNLAVIGRQFCDCCPLTLSTFNAGVLHLQLKTQGLAALLGLACALPCLALGEVMSKRSNILILLMMSMAVGLPVSMLAQNTELTASASANIIGTVADVNGDTVPNAAVLLKGPERHDEQAVTNANGFFQFSNLEPGVPYQVSIRVKDFADWTSSTITLEPGQFKILAGIQLHIETQRTEVQVHYDPLEVATEQFKAEEHQRVFGVIPNFYVSYDLNAEPLTAKMKFQLAFKVSTDPVTAAGVLLVASAKQAGDTPNYGQGWRAYGKRLGAVSADGFSDIMIGGAILPSLLHQDPRYFYQGTGTTGSRIRHAMLSPFVARYDGGHWGPNYSSLGGDLASSALSNLYYPHSNRGAGLVFGNFAIGTAERIGASLAQEFLLGKFTKRGGHVD